LRLLPRTTPCLCPLLPLTLSLSRSHENTGFSKSCRTGELLWTRRPRSKSAQYSLNVSSSFFQQQVPPNTIAYYQRSFHRDKPEGIANMTGGSRTTKALSSCLTSKRKPAPMEASRNNAVPEGPEGSGTRSTFGSLVDRSSVQNHSLLQQGNVPPAPPPPLAASAELLLGQALQLQRIHELIGNSASQQMSQLQATSAGSSVDLATRFLLNSNGDYGSSMPPPPPGGLGMATPALAGSLFASRFLPSSHHVLLGLSGGLIVPQQPQPAATGASVLNALLARRNASAATVQFQNSSDPRLSSLSSLTGGVVSRPELLDSLLRRAVQDVAGETAFIPSFNDNAASSERDELIRFLLEQRGGTSSNKNPPSVLTVSPGDSQ